MGRTLLASALLFVLLEGASSIILAVDQTGEATSRVFSTYDSLLGWTSRPSVELPHHWGWRRGVRTNSLGFRGAAEIDPVEPPGRVRVVCVGDSFAFGEGVGDDEAWCHELAAIDPRLQAVNLGQSGYGVDQSYLRYDRDAAAIEHSVVLFTFTEDDFFRMGDRTRYGYAKPVFRPVGGTVEVTNIPPPRVLPAIERTVASLARRLRTIELANRVVAKLRRAVFAGEPSPRPDLERVATVVFRGVRSLAEVRGGARVLFVYLPTLHDVRRDAPWRRRAATVLDSLGYPFADLTDSLRQVPDLQRPALFLPLEDPAAGHYSVAGNAWVARHLHHELVELGIIPPVPDVAERASPPSAARDAAHTPPEARNARHRVSRRRALGSLADRPPGTYITRPRTSPTARPTPR
jgi:hypothetical protein